MTTFPAAIERARPAFLAWLSALLVAALALAGCRASLPTSLEAPSPAASLAAPSVAPDPYAAARQRMVSDDIRARGVTDAAVLDAMSRVPRHEFVLPQHRAMAYADRPLPIAYGQTISQPYIVAAMTELLEVELHAVVLEIGTGSGYQAAILAELVRQVYTIEIVEELCVQARSRLAEMGYHNVEVICGDGYYGWQEKAPYDAIIVTCAPDHIPQPLVSQLADGGRMVIPVGPPGMYQVLWVVQRHGEEITSEQVMDVAFVPLTRRQGP